MLQRQNETIIPLIKICRLIQSCNNTQLTQFLSKLVSIFNNRKSISLWKNIILKGICNDYSNISEEIFNEIQFLLPSEKQLSINDSIQKSGILFFFISKSDSSSEYTLSCSYSFLVLLLLPGIIILMIISLFFFSFY